MIDHVHFELTISTGNSGIVEGSPLDNLAEALQKHLIDRLKSGADYGRVRDINGNTIGNWWIVLDEDEDEEEDENG